MSLVADALDLVVFVDREETASGTVRYVSEILEVHELAENGQPASTMIHGPDPAREEFDRAGIRCTCPRATRCGRAAPAWI